ncbi:unnamed protein product [Lactuca saligna]|uniref:Uncharacterized protein n=1 Tax=Lactuca saligna TaxID=75948 RepID=A0AA36A1M4_LACSI|nr:unnamed protein product [Lactuca saligna]
MSEKTIHACSFLPILLSFYFSGLLFPSHPLSTICYPPLALRHQPVTASTNGSASAPPLTLSSSVKFVNNNNQELHATHPSFARNFIGYCYAGMGATYGMAKSGVDVASMGMMSIGINPKAKSYYLFDGYAHLSSGLACGLADLSGGMAIRIVGDAGVRTYNPTEDVYI